MTTLDAPPHALQIARALSHPTRVAIMMSMNAPTRRLSPVRFSEESGEALGNCHFHFNKLRKFGCLKVVDEKKRRGATEHIYEPVKKALAWTREWQALGPVARQALAATALRGAVERCGASVDSGMFDARDGSVLAWDTAWVDQEGFDKISAIFIQGLKDTMKVVTECAERLRKDGADPAENAEGFLITYLLSTFESDPKNPAISR
jgi:hypothetical protein